MQTSVYDGGPAFFGHHVHDGGQFVSWPSMTLRDYFAAKAMQGFATGGAWSNLENMGEKAYKWADAMIKARGEA